MMCKTETVLVTGVAGGVGSSVARILVDHGYTVHGLARPEDDLSQLHLDDVSIVRGYVEDPRTIDTVMRHCTISVNCAALLPNSLNAVEPSAFHRVNVVGAVNVLEHAIRYQLKKAFFFSTISVVDHCSRRVTEDMLEDYIDGPHDPYLASKIEGEKILKHLSARYDGALHVIRPAFIYGPGNLAMWRDGLELVRTGKMALIGDGNVHLPLIFAGDIAEFVLHTINLNEDPNYAVHVLSNDEHTTMSSIFDFIAEQLGAPMPKRIPYVLVRVATELANLIPANLRSGRLKLLTKPRLRAYSKGYDMTGVNLTPLGYRPQTNSKIGLQLMLDDYLNRKQAKVPAVIS